LTACVRREFAERYGTAPRLYWAPGRVNLIGEHTDYNGGLVMPAAIDLGTIAAIAPREDARLRIASLDLPGTLDADITTLKLRGNWTDYPAGVAHLLRRNQGADLLFASTVPLGSGLSSSAAITVATALALGAASADMATAQLCQRAENTFAGAMCGIMDPFASCHGIADHALLLDCLSLTFEPVPIPPQTRLVIVNSMVRHELAGGEYNARRAACESAARKLGAPTLREAQAFDDPKLNDDERRCARHVHTENARALSFANALRSGELEEAGRLMYASHESLREDFRVSCEELDALVAIARETPGVIGARMTGGGFGGCTVNLVRADAAESAGERIRAKYGRNAEVYICRASAGAHEVTA
jgi:galactokinase